MKVVLIRTIIFFVQTEVNARAPICLFFLVKRSETSYAQWHTAFLTQFLVCAGLLRLSGEPPAPSPARTALGVVLLADKPNLFEDTGLLVTAWLSVLFAFVTVSCLF